MQGLGISSQTLFSFRRRLRYRLKMKQGGSRWEHHSRQWELVLALVRADNLARFKQTILGPLWFAIQPIGIALLLSLLFAKLMRVPHLGNSPVGFYWAGMTLWSYFSMSLGSVTMCFVSYAPVIRKIHIPPFSLALSVAIARLLPFLIQLAALMGFLLWTGQIHLGDVFSIAWTSVFAVSLALLTGLGVGLILASVSVQYRDLQHALGFLTQIWMYASPVIYPLALFPDPWRRMFFLNPITGALELFRLGMLHTAIDWEGILLSSVVAVGCLLVGVFTLYGVEERLADSV